VFRLAVNTLFLFNFFRFEADKNQTPKTGFPKKENAPSR
jgi:hypothetical protein